MQLALFAQEARDEAGMYARLGYYPCLRAALGQGPRELRDAAAQRLDTAFANVFNQPCGYYALMDFARCEGSDSVLGFIESAARYRLAAGRGDTRTQRAAAILGWLELSDFQLVSVNGVDSASPAAGGNSSCSPGGSLAPACTASMCDRDGDTAGAPTMGDEEELAADERAAAVRRSSVYLNGLPCFLLDAFRSRSAQLPSPAVAVAAIKRVVGGAASSGEELPVELFDDLLVCAMHHVESELFPRFRESPSFALYTDMQYFAFSREPLTRASFKWLRPLGRGGYGMVFAAQMLDTGKLYAIKCMDKRMIKARHATRMIVNERDVLASVDHPFIAGLQYAFQDEQEVFFVLELKAGGDLEHYLLHLNQPFSEEVVRFFAAELLLGLKFLHEHGIMHRDIKPANILVSLDGHVSLSDLGLAVFFTPSHSQLPSSDGASQAAPVSASTCSLPGSPGTLVGPLTPGTPMLTLSPFKRGEDTLDCFSSHAAAEPHSALRSGSVAWGRLATWPVPIYESQDAHAGAGRLLGGAASSFSSLSSSGGHGAIPVTTASECARKPPLGGAAGSVVVLGPLGLPTPPRALHAPGCDSSERPLVPPPRGLERRLGQFGRRGSMPLSLPVSTLSEGLKTPRLRTMSITGQLTGGGGGAALCTPLNPRGSSSRRQSFVWDAEFEFSRTEGTGVSACEEAGYLFGAHEHGVRGKAGTPGFWAPEMLFYERDGKGRRYGPAVDYWSLGCLVYALLAARGPFTVIGGDTSDDNAATLNSDPDLSLPMFSAAAVSLMRGLLHKDPRRRLGCGLDGVLEVMSHPFFAGVDWAAMEAMQVPSPFKPSVNALDSTRPVRGWSDKDKAKLSTILVTPSDQAKFKGVSFVSQKAIYREIIQNLTLTQPPPTCTEPASSMDTAARSSTSCPAPSGACTAAPSRGARDGPRPPSAVADASAHAAPRARPASAQSSAAARVVGAPTPTPTQQRGVHAPSAGRRGSTGSTVRADGRAACGAATGTVGGVQPGGHAPGPGAGKCSIM